MGVVLRGRDTDLGRDIAVKVLLETHQGKTELVQRFVEEAQISGQLQHPGIAPVYELGQFPDRRPYFAMKLVKGKTLAALLAERSSAELHDLPRLLGIFSRVCQTLAYAHARGVIHRDLKPANIMVGAFGEVQVMDWGLAKVLTQEGIADQEEARTCAETSIIRTARMDDGSGSMDSLTLAGSVLGTPAYMAPEQARGDVDLVDERADVFGLGAILCEILTGQPPFTGKEAEAQRKAKTARLDEAHARVDKCGAEAELIALAKHCLAAEPWDRPRDARQVALAMTRYEHSVAERLRQAELERAAAEARTGEEARTRQMAEAKAEEARKHAEAEAHARQLAEGKAREERKRRRLTLALAAAVLALLMVGGTGASWWLIERGAAEREVLTALEEAAKDSREGRWSDARVTLERLEGRIGTWGLQELRERVRQARIDAELVADLDEIRLRQSEATWVGLKDFDFTNTNASYRAAFAKYGIDPGVKTPVEHAFIVTQSRVRLELLAGLHDWLRIIPAIGREKLRAVLEAADDDAWRRSFREVVSRKDIAALKELARQPEAWDQPAALQYWLAWQLQFQAGIQEAETLLRKGQHQHPADFWLNYQLGFMLLFPQEGIVDRHEEAVGYLRAAIAIRPTSSAAHNLLGAALQDPEEQLGEFRRAMALDPKSAMVHNNLADLLANCADPKYRDPVQAVAEAKQAIELDPGLGVAWNTLGEAHYRAGQWQEAIAALEKALPFDNGGASEDFFFLAMANQRAGYPDKAREWYRKGAAWMDKHAPKNAGLLRYRAEAAGVLGLK
jgi:serine/threonine-protein kinase